MKFLLFLVLSVSGLAQTPFPFDKIQQLEFMADSISHLDLPPKKEEVKWDPWYAAIKKVFSLNDTYYIDIPTTRYKQRMEQDYELQSYDDGYNITTRNLQGTKMIEFSMLVGTLANSTAPKVIEKIEDVGYNSKLRLTFKVNKGEDGAPVFTSFSNYYRLFIKALDASRIE